MTRYDHGEFFDPAHAQDKRQFKFILGLVPRLEGYAYFHYLSYATQAGVSGLNSKLDTGIMYSGRAVTNPMVGSVENLKVFPLKTGDTYGRHLCAVALIS